jgi:hypothetical protein
MPTSCLLAPSTLTLVPSTTVILIPSGISEKDGVRVAEREVELLALEGGLEADALNLEILDEAFGGTLHHAGDDGAGGAIHGTGKSAVVEGLDGDFVIRDGDRDDGSEGVRHLALGAFDGNGGVFDLHLDLGWDDNGNFAYA